MIVGRLVLIKYIMLNFIKYKYYVYKGFKNIKIQYILKIILNPSEFRWIQMDSDFVFSILNPSESI